MITLITNGVKISVETHYQAEYSKPELHEFMFAYRITIENRTDHTIQLLRRNWTIYDANGLFRHVEGEGVVGQQPVMEPGQTHQYVSGCQLANEIGKMKGYYSMKDLESGSEFEVDIPEFSLLPPFKMS